MDGAQESDHQRRIKRSLLRTGFATANDALCNPPPQSPGLHSTLTSLFNIIVMPFLNSQSLVFLRSIYSIALQIYSTECNSLYAPSKKWGRRDPQHDYGGIWNEARLGETNSRRNSSGSTGSGAADLQSVLRLFAFFCLRAFIPLFRPLSPSSTLLSVRAAVHVSSCHKSAEIPTRARTSISTLPLAVILKFDFLF